MKAWYHLWHGGINANEYVKNQMLSGDRIRNNNQIDIYAYLRMFLKEQASLLRLLIEQEAFKERYRALNVYRKIPQMCITVHTLLGGKWRKGSSQNSFDKSLSALSSSSSGSDARIPTNSKMSFSFNSDSGESYIWHDTDENEERDLLLFQ